MSQPGTPSYMALLASGDLARRAEAAERRMKSCDLCPWKCRANRLRGQTGVCKTGALPLVSSAFPHMGEEACLRGWGGSGTIFFARCNLRCAFCQNADISDPNAGAGQETTPQQLAAIMLRLQAQGCHNINLVSPTHVIAPVLRAVFIAVQDGLRLPLVYNTGGYDAPSALRLLDGVIDIYMPDMKFNDAETGKRLCTAPDYPRCNRRAVQEMHRQVGDLVIDGQTGLARRGLLVRHLVLPEEVAGTAGIARFLAKQVSPETYVNIMAQYRPAHRAARENMGPLSRPVTAQEVVRAYRQAHAAGLHRFDHDAGISYQ